MTELDQLRSYIAGMQAQLDFLKVELALLAKVQPTQEPQWNSQLLTAQSTGFISPYSNQPTDCKAA